MSDFYIVDVFAKEKYTGNQLAVFLHGERFSDEEMQTLAREMHFSETTFVLPATGEQLAQSRFPVRIFTPEAELPFAGHPTLGTAFVIQQEILKKPVSSLNLELGVGSIPVTFTYERGRPDILTMQQTQPTFGKTIDSNSIASALGLASSDIDDQSPVQVVSTGVPFLIVPLRSLKAAKNVNINIQALRELYGDGFNGNVLIYTSETVASTCHYHVRVFVPELGVSEDPATGSANGCLCAYLLRYETGESQNLSAKVEQGIWIHRPSILYLNGHMNQNHYTIQIGGRVEWVAKATLL